MKYKIFKSTDTNVSKFVFEKVKRMREAQDDEALTPKYTQPVKGFTGKKY